MKSVLGCAALLIAFHVSILINDVTSVELNVNPLRQDSSESGNNKLDELPPKDQGKILSAGHKGLACEGGELPLNCPPDTFINVTSAMYGRDDKNITCPHPTAMANTSCSSNRSLSAVQALCNGRTYCDVDAVSYYFGDPCNATYKYLRVEYTCSACVNKLGNDSECEMWALLGKCSGSNQTWMEEHCAKACFKCESYISPVITNVLDDANCNKRKTAGECKSNAAYMGAYCKKACLECEQTTTCENKENDTTCDNWYNQAECSTNSDFMLGKCRKSCFNCSNIVKCENRAVMCDTWAIQGACQRNPGYMMAFCSKSCLGCTTDPLCEDKYTDCDYWAKNKECSKNAVWMHKNCWKSCVQCTGPAVCANTLTDASCEALAANGQCVSNYDFMLSNCRLTCTRCKALEYGRAKCVNALLNDTMCDALAKTGECTRNSSYMLAQCYKSCTSCYRPYRIGNSAFPGAVLEDNAAYSVVLPFGFSDTSVITQFSAYFSSLNTVYVQVWRPNATNGFEIVFSEEVTPLAINQVQAIVMKWCIVVKAGDRIGFTSFSGPAPISYKMVKNSNYLPIAMRPAASDEGFFYINAPFEYSLSADFYYGSNCN